jgi:hypothetical protein
MDRGMTYSEPVLIEIKVSFVVSKYVNGFIFRSMGRL